ncbi:GroES-like protein [Aulographum hederae CBS 113979]|uniref:GroES-like protein n=1 Tax=Aulographum hederae CBS 113979 TaxID=1176131 RepID=A0A6G1H9Z0_9PEZI|nr:GroES-like protein [Aulographum hederae CBS 113979]
MEQNKAIYLYAAKDLRTEVRKLAAPADDEVQVAIRSVTLCGSDIHYYQHYRNGSIEVREPLCLGHESAGELVALGSQASTINPDLRIGDTVALECGVPCDECDLCASMRYNICPNLRFCSSGSKFPHYRGVLQEKVNHPAQWVHKLPSELSPTVGALLEPLAVAFHAGCTDIIMVDIDEGRLQFALENGLAQVTYCVKPKGATTLEEKLDLARETAHKIGQLKWKDGTAVGQVQRVFECTGTGACLHASIYATKSGGHVVLVGVGMPNHTLPITDISAREVSLIPTWRYANDYPIAIHTAVASATGEKINSVKLPSLAKLVTHHHKGLDAIHTCL